MDDEHLGNPEFWSFRRVDEDSLYAKPADTNKRTPTTSGFPHAWFNEQPYRCFVRKRQFGDIIWTRFACLISDRFLEILRAEGISGFDVRPADVRLMFPHTPPEAKFWQFIPTGWGGIAHPDSGINQVEDPEGKNRLCYTNCAAPQKIVDKTQWDGSDVFIVWPLPMFWYVTPKFAETLRRSNVRRYRLLPYPDLKNFISDIGFSPGCLREYLSDERARAIGEPLGIY